MKIDYSLIIRQIKLHKGFKTNAQVGKFLGTTAQNVGNMIKRNSGNMENIIEKCIDFDLNELIKGGESTPSVSENIHKLENDRLNAEVLQLYRDNKKLQNKVDELKKNKGSA